MHSPSDTNKRSGSTLYRLEMRKVLRSAERHSTAAEGVRSLSGLSPLPRGTSITITATYKGGAEGWVELRARGRSVMRPGHVELLMVLLELLGEAR